MKNVTVDSGGPMGTNPGDAGISLSRYSHCDLLEESWQTLTPLNYCVICNKCETQIFLRQIYNTKERKGSLGSRSSGGFCPGL